jgi:Rps23 Pro-64 3,4-dihydroxylase Tpa1-like proline 4-hydroxylase
MPTKLSAKKKKKRGQRAQQSLQPAHSGEHHAASATPVGDPGPGLVSAIQKVCSLQFPQNPTALDLELEFTVDERPHAMDAFRGKYQAMGKGEWWWIFDDVVHWVATLLREQSFAILDGFFSTPDSPSNTCSRARDLEAEIQQRWKEGMLPIKGAIIDATDGSNTPQTKSEVRGDWIGWFQGAPSEEWAAYDDKTSLPGYMIKLSTLVTELQRFLPHDLSGIKNRSRAMITCYPPGTRYTRHVDNGGRVSNGRRLTALLYLNHSWREGDGGELAIYETDGKRLKATVQPVIDRLVLFFSDERVPHEVLESQKERFTIT